MARAKQRSKTKVSGPFIGAARGAIKDPDTFLPPFLPGNGQVLLLPDHNLLLILSEKGDVALVAARPDTGIHGPQVL
jgi:hypothetical protein